MPIWLERLIGEPRTTNWTSMNVSRPPGTTLPEQQAARACCLLPPHPHPPTAPRTRNSGIYTQLQRVTGVTCRAGGSARSGRRYCGTAPPNSGALDLPCSGGRACVGVGEITGA